MIRSILGIVTVALTVPYISLQVGNHFQTQISSADNLLLHGEEHD